MSKRVTKISQVIFSIINYNNTIINNTKSNVYMGLLLNTSITMFII